MKSPLFSDPRASQRRRALFVPLLCLALLLSTGCPPVVRPPPPPPPSPVPPVYRVVDLGTTAPNGDSEAFGINNASEVVGWVRVNGQKQATAWKNIAVQPLATPLWTKVGDNSIAYAINANNQSSGWAGGGLGAGLPYWFPSMPLWKPNVEGRAYAVADNGVTVGWSYLGVGLSNQKAVLFNGGQPIVTSTPVGQPFDLGNFGTDNSRAYGVNRALHIVGAAATASGPTHAFHHVGISKLQSTDDLGTLGGLVSEACSINATAQVAGWSDVKKCPSTPVRHAFLWEKNQMQDLGTPYPTLPVSLKDPGGVLRNVWWVSTLVRSLDGDGGRCITDRQNKEGQPQVVGYSILYYPFAPPKPYDPLCISPEPAEFHRAWMWNGRMHDLNDLIPPNSGWYLLEAWGINDQGQIVGRGMHNGQIHAYALLP